MPSKKKSDKDKSDKDKLEVYISKYRELVTSRIQEKYDTFNNNTKKEIEKYVDDNKGRGNEALNNALISAAMQNVMKRENIMKEIIKKIQARFRKRAGEYYDERLGYHKAIDKYNRIKSEVIDVTIQFLKKAVARDRKIFRDAQREKMQMKRVSRGSRKGSIRSSDVSRKSKRGSKRGSRGSRKRSIKSSSVSRGSKRGSKRGSTKSRKSSQRKKRVQ